MEKIESEKWDLIIDGKRNLFDLKLKEVWNYRDLIQLFVKRDFVANFKQTILGPLWFVIQPLFQAFMIFFVFGKIAGFQPEGVPGLSFYLAGVMCWMFFTTSLTGTSETFITNAGIFGKIYFPRLVTPISVVLSAGLKFLIQFLLFVVIYIVQVIIMTDTVPNIFVLTFPLVILMIGLLGLGMGLIISALTTKYRDLKFLIQFGIQFLMYASTVPYPLYKIREQSTFFETIVLLNPMSSIIELVRYSFLGENSGEIHVYGLLYSIGVTLLLLIVGIVLFNKVEKNFIDTV